MAFSQNRISAAGAQSIFTDVEFSPVCDATGKVVMYKAKRGDDEYGPLGITALCRILYESK